MENIHNRLNCQLVKPDSTRKELLTSTEICASLSSAAKMGRMCDKHFVLWSMKVLVLQVWLQLLKLPEAVCQQNQVLQLCNVTTKPAALFPFNEHYQGQEVIKRNLKVRFSKVRFSPGVNGGPEGAIEFLGEHDSFIEIEPSDQLDFNNQSMSMLVFVHPYVIHTGPLVHYNAGGHGVQMWIHKGIVSEKGQLMARFVQRDLSLTSWLIADVLNLGQWNYIGASYNHVTGLATLYHDGLEVQRMQLDKNLHLATDYEIRLGAFANSQSFGAYKGEISCLQFYSKALELKEVLEVKNACNPVVPLQYLSINLTSPVHVAEANETLLTVNAGTNGNATKPAFHFDFGDGTVSQQTFSSTARHTYRFIGNYTINVKAWSLCNTSTRTTTANISVLKPVRILKNISLHSKATLFGKPTHFRLFVGEGSDFTCLWLLGDNVNHSISRSNPGVILLSHVYAAPSTYTAQITCKNRRSELTISTIVLVQKIVTGLKIHPVPLILFGTQFQVKWRVDDGTGVEYKANFSDVSLEVVKSDDELHGEAWVTKEHYNTPGEFFVCVAASNLVTKWISTKVKCRIRQGVIPFRPIAVFDEARDIEVNETVSISFTDVNSVPEINATYIVSFGDASEVVITRDTFVDHSYQNHGFFTVNITADNGVSDFNTSIAIKVRKPVVKLQGAMIHPVVAKVNETVNITMSFFTGSDFVCQWQFGDSQHGVQDIDNELIYFTESELRNISMSTTHVFEDVGVYKISGTCKNRLSETRAISKATIQKEITRFQVSPVAPVIYGETFFINFSIASGTNVSFKAFLNQRELKIETLKCCHLCKVTPDLYEYPGQYNITITAENLVTPKLRHTQAIFIEVPVAGVRINMSYLEANILHTGHGPNRNIFPENIPVLLQATADNGTGLQYTWSIDNTEDLLRNETVMRTFYAAGLYMVSIRVENHVSRVVTAVQVAVQKRAAFSNGGLVECSTPNVLKETIIVKATMQTLGTNSTLRFDMDNTTSYWYGDHENHLGLEKNDNNTDLKYNGKLRRTITLRHVYNTPGIYIITAVLGNAVSKSLSTCEVEILPRPCKKPTVTFKNVGVIPEDARSFFVVDSINIEADVDVFCPESKEPKYEWKIFQNNPKTRLFDPFNYPPLNKEATMQELRLRRVLPIGLFKISLMVGMVEDDLKEFMAVAEGYLKIVQSPLIATISGGSEIRRGFGPTLSVDGQDSHDPDVGPGNHTGMEFIWFCRNTTERFPKVIAQVINGTVGNFSEDLLRSSTADGKGCYGNGKYLLLKAGTLLELRTSQMKENESYVVLLVVKKGNRTSYATQLLELGPKSLPSLAIRCEVNCGAKRNPSEKMALSSTCKGNSCTSSLVYSWSLFVFESQTNESEPTWLHDKIMLSTHGSYSLSNFPNIIFKKNTLQWNKEYKLDVTATVPDGIYGRASISFQVNAPPTGGTCDVQPRVGHVLTTKFRFWCAGWRDPDGPLSYEIAHVRDAAEFLLYYGGVANTSIGLPLGDGDNYTMDIAVRVSDRLGASTLVSLQVQSLPSNLNDLEMISQLSKLVSSDRPSLASLVKTGKYQELGRIVGSICSILNRQVKVAKEEDAPLLLEKRKQVREALIMATAGQAVVSQQSVRLKSGSLYLATQVVNEISTDAQEASTIALANMATFLNRESRETGSGSVNSVATDMSGTIGNLLGSASDDAAVNQPNITNLTSAWTEEQPNNKNNRTKGKSVKTLFTVLNSVLTTVLRRKIPFEEATEISTPGLSISLKSSFPSSVGGKVQTGFADFKLPTATDLFSRSGKLGLTSVNQKVLSMPRNYFTYDETAKDIRSPVVSLSFEDKDNEKPIAVSNLKKPVEFSLPAPEVLPEPDEFSVTVTENTWAYHKLVISSKDEAVSIEAAPLNCSHKLHIYVQENDQPTKQKYLWKKEIWRPFRDKRTTANYTRCFETFTAYTLFISNKELRESTYIVGIFYENGEEESPKNTKEIVQIKYAIRMYKTKCLYWNERMQKWMGNGCVVGPLTNSKRIHCMTSHLTSFGSGMFVAPTPIDFKKVFAGFEEAFDTGNVVVIFTMLGLFVLYAVLALWARRTDKKDFIQIGATILPFYQDCDYRYELYFVTGSRNGSGTTAHVGCEVLGESHSSGTCYLIDLSRPLFRRGDLNVFILSLPSCLGMIRGLRVWHDNSGKSPGWFLNRAMVRDCQTGDKWIFLPARWLDVAEEDGKVNVVLRPANEQYMASFNKVFNTKLRKGICDNHLWFSVAYRPPRSPFTRLQRLSCCLSLLFSFMVATAMFYGSTPQPGDPSGDFQMGPIKLNMRTIIIGIESALVVIPVNILIVAFFRNSRAKEVKYSETTNCCGDSVFQTSEQESLSSDIEVSSPRLDQETDLNDIHCTVSSEGDYHSDLKEDVKGSEISLQLQDESEDLGDRSSQEAQNPGLLAKIRAKFRSSGGSSTPCFPYWCVYVGWTLCILTTLTSAVFTLFYSMMWGKEQSNLWLVTMFISFVQDTLISQPLKVVIVSMIFAILSSSPDGEDDLEETSSGPGPDEKLVNQDQMSEDFSQYDPPEGKLLKTLRAQELKRRQTIKLFTDLCVYVVLLTIVIMLSFQYRNPDSYKMINSLRRVFVNPLHNSSRVRFDQVNTINSIWDWTRKTLLPGLHQPPLYDGLHNESYLGDRMSLQLGLARLRQVRVLRGTCKVNKWFKDSFAECNDFYSLMREDTKYYSTGWQNGREKPARKEKGNMFRFLTSKSDRFHTSWEHMNALEAHHTLPVIGMFSSYNGGGYVVNLNRTLEDTKSVIDHHQVSSWLDAHTRAVHAEFVAYNPTINMVAAVTMTFELPPMGGIFKSSEVFAVSMYSSLRKHPAVRITGEVVAAILLVIMIFRVALAIFHDKCRYFKDLSKVLDLILVLTGVAIVFLGVLKEGFKKLATDQFHEDPKQFLDYYQCGFYDELTDYAFAFLNFIAIVRFSVFLQFLSCLDRISRTIARCFYELLACLFVFFCLMMAFASLFKLAFNSDNEDFKDFSSSLQTSISYMARMIRSKEASSSHTIIRAVVLFSCCLTLIFFYLTMIKTIFIVGYRQTLMEDRGKTKEKSFEVGIFEMFRDKFMEIAGMEKEDVIVKEEEEDPKEIRLRALKNYFDRSQFVRLQSLTNEAYTEDFGDDLTLFKVMRSTNDLKDKINSSDLQAQNASSTNEEKLQPKLDVVAEKGLTDADNDGKKGKAQVKFNLNPIADNGNDTSRESDPYVSNTTSLTNKGDKLKLLEQLVQEKMRALQRQQQESSPESLAHEIQLLVRLQQRIDAKNKE